MLLNWLGGTLIRHRHPQVEEFCRWREAVFAGEFLQAGDYHRAEAGTVHPVTPLKQGLPGLVATLVKERTDQVTDQSLRFLLGAWKKHQPVGPRSRTAQ